MTLFWIIFPIVTFIFVLSWTDLKSHVGYAFHCSLEEGIWKFPLIWIQSFFIPVSFLCSNRSKFDYDSISALDRALRIGFNNPSFVEIEKNSHSTKVLIKNESKRIIVFKIPKNDNSVEINGADKLIPPRLARMMIALYKNSPPEEKQKKKSLLD